MRTETWKPKTRLSKDMPSMPLFAWPWGSFAIRRLVNSELQDAAEGLRLGHSMQSGAGFLPSRA